MENLKKIYKYFLNQRKYQAKTSSHNLPTGSSNSLPQPTGGKSAHHISFTEAMDLMTNPMFMINLDQKDAVYCFGMSKMTVIRENVDQYEYANDD